MRNKESWYLKLIRFFYGIRDDLDEYRIQEINRIGNNSFMMLATYVFMMSMVDIFLQSVIGFKMTLIITIFINWFALLSILIYGSQAIQKLNLDQIDSYDEHDYQTWIKKTKLRAIALTIIFFICYQLGNVGFNLMQGKSFLHALLSLSNNGMGVVTAIVFGISIYYTMKKKIKK